MIVKFKIYILALLVLPVIFKANHNRKAYEALSIHDYFKARKLFYKSYMQKANSAAAFGLATIFSRNNNPFFHPDSAIKYANAAFYLNASDTGTKAFGSFKINQQIIRDFIDSLGAGKLQTILNLNSPEQLNHFLKDYSACSENLLNAAIIKRDELAFKLVKKQNNSLVSQQFIIIHPYSLLLKDAILLKDKQIYDEITASKDAPGYINYIRMFPGSIHVTKAYRELLNLYKKNKNPADIYTYIRSYPLSPQIQEAWKTLFTLSVSTYSDEELQGFLKKYPDFPFKNSLIRELQLNKQILIPLTLHSKTGFADTSGNILINPEYDEAGEFLEGLCVAQKGDSVMYINKENKIFLNRVFEEAFPFHHGVAPVKLKGKWFFMNRMGEPVSDTLDEINALSDDSYICRKNNLYGSLNVFTEPEIPFQYEKLGDFINKAAYYQRKNMFGFITKSGYAHEAEFDWISDFNKAGQAVFRKGAFFGIVKDNGEQLLPAAYDRILAAPGNIYLLIKNNLYGFYSAEGCYLSEMRYQYIPSDKPDDYTNGKLLKLNYKDKLTLCDLNGKPITEPGQYQEIHMNKDNLIRVFKNNKYGYVNHKGQLVIPLKFSEASDFTDSTAIVKTRKNYSLINQSGKELFASDYEIERIAKNIFSTENDNEETIYVDARGNILPYKIKDIETYGNYQILYLENDSIKILKQP